MGGGASVLTMGTWAGVRRGDLREIKSRGLAPGKIAKRLSDVRYTPVNFSVHLVEDGETLTVCGQVDAGSLEDAGKPWEQWIATFRCRRCQELRPEG